MDTSLQERLRRKEARIGRPARCLAEFPPEAIAARISGPLVAIMVVEVAEVPGVRSFEQIVPPPSSGRRLACS
jgi:hypothetical protein